MSTKTETADDYRYWHQRLTGAQIETHPEEPQSGRWRLPASRTNRADGKTPISWPCAIWRKDGKAHVLIGKKLISEGTDEYHEFACGGWLRAVPVSVEVYDAAMKGEPWPDEHEAVKRNSLPGEEEDSLEAIKDRLEDLTREAEGLIKKGAAKTKDEADRAADLANLIAQHQKRADDLRVAEKQPFLDGGRDVDAKWRPIIGMGDIYKRLKSVVLTPFLTAAAALEKKKREEEAAAQVQRGETAAPVEQRGAPLAVAGSRGRPTGLVTVKSARIDDYEKALAALKNSPKVKSLIQDLCDASARSGIAIDGCTVIETQQAR